MCNELEQHSPQLILFAAFSFIAYSALINKYQLHSE